MGPNEIEDGLTQLKPGMVVVAVGVSVVVGDEVALTDGDAVPVVDDVGVVPAR